jgi:hypothetical protein
MKWTYSVKNKLIVSLALLVLSMLVLISNYNDREHTREVKETINTMYKDRLMAESYIMNLTVYMYALKEVYALEQNTGLKNTLGQKEIFNKIANTSKLYDQTVFTKDESIKYGLYNDYMAKIQNDSNININQKIDILGGALAVLTELSSIQLDESKRIIKKTEQLYESGKLTSDFALAVIVILLIVLQVLVFAAKGAIDGKNTENTSQH